MRNRFLCFFNILIFIFSFTGCNKNVDYNSFENFYDVTFEETTQSYTINGFNKSLPVKYQKRIYIPKSFKGYPITKINDNAFSDNNYIEEICPFPSSLEEIGDFNFMRLHNIKTEEIVIPSTIKSVGIDFFYDSSSNIKKIKYYSSYSIPFGFFSFNSNLEEIIINTENNISIGGWAFFECKNLKDINLCDNIVEITKSAFCGIECESQINLPRKLEILGVSCFSNSNITSIAINSNFSLKYLNYGDGTIYSIKDAASLGYLFFNTNINSISINNCVDYQSDTNNYIRYNDELIYATNRTIISNQIRKINQNAFKWVAENSSYTIPNTVEEIESNAFSSNYNVYIKCNLKEKPEGWEENWQGNHNNVEWLE